jgi:hypothetical protein
LPFAIEEVDRFDLSAIKRTYGDGHHQLIGKWIDWWIEGDKDRRIAWSEAPRLPSGNCSDIMFLESLQGDYYDPVGVAEVENDEKKWDEKIKTMVEYARNISSIDFLLLSTWSYPEVAQDKRMKPRAERLLSLLQEKIEEATKNAEFKLIVHLILRSAEEPPFLVKNIPWKHETDQVVYYRRRPSEVKLYLAQNGNVCFWENRVLKPID